MIKGTTPMLTLTVSDSSIDLGAADAVYVTIRQGETHITLTGPALEISGNVVRCWIPQKKALLLSPDKGAAVQINWVYHGGRRAATKVREIRIGAQMLGRVIP